MRPTTIYSLSAELGANTIDPDELNCRVRNGYGCCLVGIIISLIPTPSRSRTSYKRSNLFNKGIIIGREQQFLCKPVGISLTAFKTGHRLPSNYYYIR